MLIMVLIASHGYEEKALTFHYFRKLGISQLLQETRFKFCLFCQVVLSLSSHEQAHVYPEKLCSPSNPPINLIVGFLQNLTMQIQILLKLTKHSVLAGAVSRNLSFLLRRPGSQLQNQHPVSSQKLTKRATQWVIPSMGYRKGNFSAPWKGLKK